jgi:hypothetical protein
MHWAKTRRLRGAGAADLERGADGHANSTGCAAHRRRCAGQHPREQLAELLDDVHALVIPVLPSRSTGASGCFLAEVAALPKSSGKVAVGLVANRLKPVDNGGATIRRGNQAPAVSLVAQLRDTPGVMCS